MHKPTSCVIEWWPPRDYFPAHSCLCLDQGSSLGYHQSEWNDKANRSFLSNTFPPETHLEPFANSDSLSVPQLLSLWFPWMIPYPRWLPAFFGMFSYALSTVLQSTSGRLSPRCWRESHRVWSRTRRATYLHLVMAVSTCSAEPSNALPDRMVLKMT